MQVSCMHEKIKLIGLSIEQQVKSGMFIIQISMPRSMLPRNEAYHDLRAAIIGAMAACK